MELFLVGIIIAGFSIWGLSNIFYALLTWGIGISIIGIGFLIAEQNIWDYMASISKRFEREE